MAKPNRLALSALVVLSLAAFAAAQSYTVTDLGPGEAFAINSLGDVVINNIDLSFLWTPTHSSLNLHPLPGGTFTRAQAINRYGLVAGYSNGPVDYHAVVWNEGEPQDLGTLPGGIYSQGYAINASGEVAGGANTATIRAEAMVWTQAMGMQGLGTFAGGSISDAYAINRFGQVVGYSDSNNGTFAFIGRKLPA